MKSGLARKPGPCVVELIGDAALRDPAGTTMRSLPTSRPSGGSCAHSDRNRNGPRMWRSRYVHVDPKVAGQEKRVSAGPHKIEGDGAGSDDHWREDTVDLHAYHVRLTRKPNEAGRSPCRRDASPAPRRLIHPQPLLERGAGTCWADAARLRPDLHQGARIGRPVATWLTGRTASLTWAKRQC